MLLVGTNVKYASNSNTVNAAITPDMLDSGSIGIYTVGSDGKLKLVVTSGTSPTADQILSTSVKKSDKITMFVGLGSGSVYPSSETLDVSGIQKILGSVYRAGTQQVSYIGFNGTSGSLNMTLLPTSGVQGNGLTYTDPDLLYRQEASIKFRTVLRGNNEFGNVHYYSVKVSPTDTEASLLAKFVTAINQVQPGETRQFHTAALTGSAIAATVANTPTTATTGGTIAASAPIYIKVFPKTTNGIGPASNEVNITVGSGTSTNTVTVTWTNVTGNSGYRISIGSSAGGENKYVDVAADVVTYTYVGSGTSAGVTAPSSGAGLSITALPTTTKTLYNNLTTFPVYKFSVFGVIDNADVTQGGPVQPSGAPFQIRDFEIDSLSYRGDLYRLSGLDPHLPSQVDFSATYDTYYIKTINTGADKTGQKATSDTEITTMIAFVVQGNTSNTNQQADWEDIMTDIFPDTAQIS